MKLDYEDDKELIIKLEKLNSDNKLGDYLTNLAKQEKNMIKEKDYLEHEIKDLRNRVEEIRQKALSTYALAELGKRIGLEDKSKTILRAHFILRKQLDDIAETLGLDIHEIQSVRIDEYKKQVNELLELIINSYDELMEEVINGVGNKNIGGEKIDNSSKVLYSNNNQYNNHNYANEFNNSVEESINNIDSKNIKKDSEIGEVGREEESIKEIREKEVGVEELEEEKSIKSKESSVKSLEDTETGIIDNFSFKKEEADWEYLNMLIGD